MARSGPRAASGARRPSRTSSRSRRGRRGRTAARRSARRAGSRRRRRAVPEACVTRSTSAQRTRVRHDREGEPRDEPSTQRARAGRVILATAPARPSEPVAVGICVATRLALPHVAPVCCAGVADACRRPRCQPRLNLLAAGATCDGRAHRASGRGRTARRTRPGRCRARSGVTRYWVVMPGTASIFMRNAGTQKSWMTSLERTWNSHRLSFGQVELVGVDRLAAGACGYSKVHANCWPVTSTTISSASASSRCRAAPRRRSRTRPTRMSAGIAVQMTSRRVLPWIGGPSLSSSPGRMRNFQTQNRTTTIDQHEDRDRGDDQHVVERVDLARPASRPPAGTSRSTAPSAMPIADAITPMTTSATS